MIPASQHHPAHGAAKDRPWLGPSLPPVSKLWIVLNRVIYQMKASAHCSHCPRGAQGTQCGGKMSGPGCVPCGCHHHQLPLAPRGGREGGGLGGGHCRQFTPHPEVRATLQTLKPAAPPPPVLRAWGFSCELSPRASRLLALEIRDLLLIGRRPRTRPRTRGAPLSVLLTGEMSKPLVTVALRCSRAAGSGCAW